MENTWNIKEGDILIDKRNALCVVFEVGISEFEHKKIFVNIFNLKENKMDYSGYYVSDHYAEMNFKRKLV